MKVFVINLSRRPDRMADIERDLGKYNLGYERVEAVDGKTDPAVKQHRRPILTQLFGRHAFTDGMIGNYLSHRKIWQKMVDENISRALILEDDALISDWDERILNFDPSNLGLDVLRLGANFEPILGNSNDYRTLKDKAIGRKLITGKIWGTVASIVTVDAARKYLQLKKYWFPMDHFFSYEKTINLRSAILSPQIWKTSQSKSDISIPKKNLGPIEILILKFTKKIRRQILYPALYLYLRVTTKLKIPVV